MSVGNKYPEPEKTGPKNQWFKPVISENKSLVRKKLVTDLKKLTSGFWDLAKITPKTTGYFHFNQWFWVNFWLSPKNHWLIFLNQ